ncbi:hypothetical protein ACFQO4_03040 [Saliphagus sp. GCM10025334]
MVSSTSRPTFHVEELGSFTNQSGTYYKLKLPKEIAEIGLEPSETIKLKHGKEETDDGMTRDADPPYLTGKYYPGKLHHLKGGYTVGGKKEGPTVTFPSYLTDKFLEHDGIQQLLVEINRGEKDPHLRIYKIVDYFETRYPELVEKGRTPKQGAPVAIAAAEFEQGFTDLTNSEPNTGQRVRIVPIKPVYKPLIQTVSNVTGSDDVVVTAERFHQFQENHEMEAKTVDRLEIRWLPDHKQYRPWFNDKASSADSELVYQEFLTDEACVTLPERGAFMISAYSSTGEGKTWLSNYSLDEETDLKRHSYTGYQITPDWRGMYFPRKQPDTCLEIYLPIPAQTTSEDRNITWWH